MQIKARARARVRAYTNDALRVMYAVCVWSAEFAKLTKLMHAQVRTHARTHARTNARTHSTHHCWFKCPQVRRAVANAVIVGPFNSGGLQGVGHSKIRELCLQCDLLLVCRRICLIIISKTTILTVVPCARHRATAGVKPKVCITTTTTTTTTTVLLLALLLVLVLVLLSLVDVARPAPSVKRSVRALDGLLPTG